MVATVVAVRDPRCGPPVNLPREGNGLGFVLALIVPGLAGTVVIRRIVAGGRSG